MIIAAMDSAKANPTEQNTYKDIEAAWQYLTTTHENIPPNRRIIIHGRSVGSGPSVWLAERHPVGGLILESPFLSAYRVVNTLADYPLR